MISRVADYEMVDVSGLGRFVKGQILPVREGGAKRALKYEDLLFLKEGKLERQNWTLAANAAAKANKAAAPSRWLRKNVFESAVCSGTWSEYRDANKEITEGMTAYGPIEAIVGNVVMLGSFNAGRTAFKLEKLEKAYENMEKLKRTLYGYERLISQPIKIRSKTLNTVSGEITTYPDESYTSDLHIYESNIRSGGYPIIGAETWTCQGKCKMVEIQMPYAVRGWLIANTSVSINNNPGSGEDWVIMECEVTKEQGEEMATVRLEKDLGEIARTALERHGGNYVEEPNFSMVNQDVKFYNKYLLIEHDFPASEPEVG